MAEVAFEHVAKLYAGGVIGLDDFGLTVADGELVVIVGPSGSGKTTILRLIAGLERPSTGEIRIDGRVVNDCPPRERDVAFVFQRPSLMPHMNVAQNLGFGMQLRQPIGAWSRWLRPIEHRRQQEERRERVGQAARLLDLQALLDRKPHQLSGGQQQRVALGRAFVRQPAVFLLDEPLSNLDWQLRAELRRELHLLQRRLRATMIYVTHDQLEALTLGDRIVVLRDGALQQADAPDAVYARPRNRFVAGFIGWPPMNFVEGRIESAEDRVCFRAVGLTLLMARQFIALVGREVVLGIRPESVRLNDGERHDARMTMEVALVEYLGNDVLATCERDGLRISARTQLSVVCGQLVEVSFDMHRIHWFDRCNGAALPAPEG